MPEPIRVTTVLNYFKEPWYVDWVCRVGKREANRISKAAQKIGTRVDEIIKAKPFDAVVYHKDSDSIENCILAYNKWLGTYQPKSIIPCTRLNAVIEEQEVTGEPDLLVDDVLVDIKCSSKISMAYWVQVNMYGNLMLGKTVDLPFNKVAILRLDKETASYEYVVKDYDPNLVNVWIGMLRAYVYFKGEQNDGDEL